METGRPRPTSEEEANRVAKQQKVSYAPNQEYKGRIVSSQSP